MKHMIMNIKLLKDGLISFIFFNIFVFHFYSNHLKQLKFVVTSDSNYGRLVVLFSFSYCP